MAFEGQASEGGYTQLRARIDGGIQTPPAPCNGFVALKTTLIGSARKFPANTNSIPQPSTLDQTSSTCPLNPGPPPVSTIVAAKRGVTTAGVMGCKRGAKSRDAGIPIASRVISMP